VTTAIRTALSGVRARCFVEIPVDLLLATSRIAWRRSGASTSCSTRGVPPERPGLDGHLTRVKIAFLCPHLRIAGACAAS